MSIDLRIAGGTVVTPEGARQADVLVNAGTIAGIVARGSEVADANRVIDATGKVVMPGMIDVHVHTRQPGYEHKEDIYTTTLQAAAGGVTTIFGMPNLNPPTTTLERLQDVFRMYRESSIVDWNHNPAATIQDEIVPMANEGICAFKIYMVVDTGRTYPHPSGTGMHDHGDLLRMMDTIAPTGVRLIIHPHDQSLMDYIEGQYLGRGENTPEAYAQAYAAREGVIWDTAVDVILRLAEASNCPLHIAHMQTRRSIEAVRRAKERGINVTCEVNHWALFLSTWDDVQNLGPYALSYWVPDDAREAIWEALRDGTIDMLSSDHAPHTREEKEIGWTQMWSCHTGTPGIQFQVPLLLDAVNRGVLTLPRAVETMTSAPARAFGLDDRKGSLEPGFDADIVIADMNQAWTIRDDGVLSKIGWTCYNGRDITAAIDRTFLRGREVFADNVVTGEPGYGQMAVRSSAEQPSPAVAAVANS